MAQNAVPDNVYPLATAEGLAIPLAVARPKGNIHVAVAKDATQSISFPESVNLVSCYFDQDIDLWLVTPSAIVNNVYTPGLMALSGGVAYDLVLPANVWLVAHHATTTGYINVLERWAQLQNTGSYGVS